MRILVGLLVVCLAGCMKPSDLADGTVGYLRDAGFLDHSHTQRMGNWRIQADSFVFIAQGFFVPPGSAYPRPNVVAEEAFNSFVEYFPRVRRAPGPMGLDDAMAAAREAGADYLLYTRFAAADDRIGTVEEWEDQGEWGRLGLDSGVIELMLLEVGNGFLVDTARIRSRGGFLTFYDNSPQDLIGPPLLDYARHLIGFSR